MTTMKRRIVYLSDEQWETLQERGRRHKVTVSALIRIGMGLERNTSMAELRLNDPYKAEIAPPGPQVPFSTRPFTPVPKSGKR